MDIEYANKHLRKLCEQNRFAVQELGVNCAKKLQTRIADLQSANDVLELPAGKPHPLQRDRKGQYAISLPDGKRIIFVPANNPTPMIDDKNIDWSRVTKIRIIEIGDYHD
jgi:proteic killer suppression protein